MDREVQLLREQKQRLIEQIREQAELYLAHNVGECRSRRNERNRWLFQCGMKQGIESGIEYFLENYQTLMNDTRPLSQVLFDHKKHVVETCLIMPHKAVQEWGLTELTDKLDVEREDVICGIQHGLCAIGHNLPRLLKKSVSKPKTKGPRMEALSTTKSLRK